MHKIQLFNICLLIVATFTACASGQPSLSKEEYAIIDADLQKRYEKAIATWSPLNWPPLPKDYQKIVERMLVPKGRDPRDFPAIWQEEPIKELVVFARSSDHKGKFQPVRSPKVGTKPYWMTCVESGSPETTTYDSMYGGVHIDRRTGYGTVCVAWQDGKPYAAGARHEKGNSKRTPLYGNNWTFIDPEDYYSEVGLSVAPDGAWPAKKP